MILLKLDGSWYNMDHFVKYREMNPGHQVVFSGGVSIILHGDSAKEFLEWIKSEPTRSSGDQATNREPIINILTEKPVEKPNITQQIKRKIRGK